MCTKSVLCTLSCVLLLNLLIIQALIFNLCTYYITATVNNIFSFIIYIYCTVPSDFSVQFSRNHPGADLSGK
jgi:hypothetical protein